ncbi:MAG: M3 family metallopeptidase [Firmicutes bacterium]|nr:M3 family metallopeptidase [Bacillota bacterium]MCM1401608.1 M3 family metallopeptidase [Bacteroides sp.]MCM1477230.1 M3 family metallopeptidase [Bacteroides sp.]
MNNPLLSTFSTPHNTIPFRSIENSHYLPAIKEGITRGLEEIDHITANNEQPDFQNTIVALERSGAQLDRVLNVFFPLLSANADDEMMQISLDVTPLLSDYSTSISLNQKLWERIKYVHDHTDRSKLTAEERTLLKETYDSFARSGALLQGADRDGFKEITARLSELTTRFGQNVLKELNTYEVYLHREDLDGLTEHLIEQASEAAKQKGRDGEYLFTLAQPTYVAFMKYSSRRDLREKMFRLYTGRNINGEFSNMDIVKEIANLRLELAKLLGHPTFAHYVLEHTMAGVPEKVFNLLNSLRDAYSPYWVKELAELTEYASKFEGKAVELQPWDYSYYSNKLREEKYAYNEEEMRPYFKLENVIDGVFGLAEKLYGLKFSERTDVDVYHPDVKAFEVKNEKGEYLGMIYTDFFPRSTKRPGAWMTEFKAQWIEPDGTNSRPHISIVMNFTKPTPSKPSLLTPYEVSTFLHEFGHALHGLLSNVHYASLSGTNVRRDFVELPSQFNENFLTQKEFLDGFARHYLTNETIPTELIERLVATSHFGAAYACLRQLGFGYMDMAWHSITAPVDSVEEIERESTREVQTFAPVAGSLMSPQFSHIFAGGYAAGYYSYKWAEVLDADAFAKFKADGIFNRDTANSFRHNILERGGTENPAELYRRFRGSEPSIEPLLRRDGIIK